MVKIMADGSRWANDCALCRNERKTGVGAFRPGEEPECSWCRSVRKAYGSYWYPITESNRHLFDTKLPAGVQEVPREPCLRGKLQQPEPSCVNRHQCWEPCGELGKSAEHVRVGVQEVPVATEPKPCPWCRYPRTRPLLYATTNASLAAICGHCGAHGPYADTEEAADAAWNQENQA